MSVTFVNSFTQNTFLSQFHYEEATNGDLYLRVVTPTTPQAKLSDVEVGGSYYELISTAQQNSIYDLEGAYVGSDGNPVIIVDILGVWKQAIYLFFGVTQEIYPFLYPTEIYLYIIEKVGLMFFIVFIIPEIMIKWKWNHW